MAIDVPFYTKAGESRGTVSLSPTLFDDKGSLRVLHEVIIALQANQRQGTSSTLTRGEVRGGGRKPWKQKGTGNARAGSIRSPLWRKGGIIFGPHPRSYRIDVGAQKRDLALRTALYEKAQAGQLSVVESLSVSKGKTSEITAWFKKAGVSEKMLVVVAQKTPELIQSVRNVAHISLVDARELNPLLLLRARKVFITNDALESLEHRLPQGKV